MTLNLGIPSVAELKHNPCIVIMGVGGAGCNVINNMITSQLQGVDFIAVNTDAQALSYSSAEKQIQLGLTVTQGLGAGAVPEVGRKAAEETEEVITQMLKGANMLFLTAGMGGGTGTGATPVIARISQNMGILTVGVVTKPFLFEGSQRRKIAEKGIADLEGYLDTLIVIPNQNLFRVVNEKTTFSDAFKMADNILYAGIKSITDLMVMPGLINLDFSDIRSIMSGMGRAMMGSSEVEGPNRALEAAEKAIANPLLEDSCMRGAQGVLVNITGGEDMTLFEVDEAANRIREEIEGDPNIIFGSCVDPSLEGRIRVSVLAVGMQSEAMKKESNSVKKTSEAAASPKISSMYQNQEGLSLGHRGAMEEKKSMQGGGAMFSSVDSQECVAEKHNSLREKGDQMQSSFDKLMNFDTEYPAQKPTMGRSRYAVRDYKPFEEGRDFSSGSARNVSEEGNSLGSKTGNIKSSFEHSFTGGGESFLSAKEGVLRKDFPKEQNFPLSLDLSSVIEKPYEEEISGEKEGILGVFSRLKRSVQPKNYAASEEGINTKEIQDENKEKENALDIPSFLRRQAN